MKIAALLVVVLLGCTATEARAQAVGFVVAGPAGRSGFFGSAVDSLHVAGGADLVIRDRLGVGGDFGFFSRLLTASATATWHIAGRRATDRALPFLFGGYSLMGIGDGEGAFSTWVVGAGVDIDRGKRWAFRLEFRDHIRPDRRGTVQYWSVGGGLAVRDGRDSRYP